MTTQTPGPAVAELQGGPAPEARPDPATCLDCGGHRPKEARGLCGTCYARHRHRGTLHEYPREPQGVGVPQIRGITYRQLTYWAAKGYLQPAGRGKSGYHYYWPESEIRVAQMMARLTAAGLGPATAARVARGETEIAPGVRVVVDP